MIGTYSLLAHKQDFEARRHARNYFDRRYKSANVQLQLGVTAVKEEIEVTGAAGEIRTDEPQLGDRLGQEQLQE